MSHPGGISEVLGRIERIDARFTPAPPSVPQTGSPPVAGFEPFGEFYDRAVAARSASTVAQLAVAQPIVGPSRSPAAQVGAAPANAVRWKAAAAIAGHAGPPGVRPVGGYGAMPIPTDLAAYGNGRVPKSALARVNQPGANHRLHAPAAASWNNLVAEAAANGFDLRITDSYRSYEQQVDLVRRKGLYSEGGYAAVPGTSNHGWGLAVDADVNNPDLRRWLQENAPRFGWVEAVPREPWHWEFRPEQV